MTHSPGKIAVERNVIAGDINHLALTIRKNDPQWIIASVTPMRWLKPIDEANAARLAHCWNTHDEFKALAEALLTCLSYPRGSEAQVRCLEEVGLDARALLAKEPTI